MIIIFTKKKLLIKTVCAVFLCLFLFHFFIPKAELIPTASINNTKGYIAIIIDDFGYDGEGTEEMLALDIPLTAAIMPFSEKSAQDSQAVDAAGKETIIHMPMESLTGKKEWVGNKGVFRTMSNEEIKQRVDEACQILPSAKGINNHMGSAIMEDERSITTVIEAAAERGLTFIDSKTTPKSKAKTACNTYGVSYLDRDVFLDSTDDVNVVKKQLLKAQDIALKNGYAIAIGHVGPEGGKITAQAIKELAPEIQKSGIQFVTVSQMKEIILIAEKEKEQEQEQKTSKY